MFYRVDKPNGDVIYIPTWSVTYIHKKVVSDKNFETKDSDVGIIFGTMSPSHPVLFFPPTCVVNVQHHAPGFNDLKLDKPASSTKIQGDVD